MITKNELLLIPKGTMHVIEWDKSKIVEVLLRKKRVGAWGFYIKNVISGKTYVLRKDYERHYFTIIPQDGMLTLGQLLPKKLQKVEVKNVKLPVEMVWKKKD